MYHYAVIYAAKQCFNVCTVTVTIKILFYLTINKIILHITFLFRILVPVVVVNGMVLVASIGATVAAATGVTVLKIGFCKEMSQIYKMRKNKLLMKKFSLFIE